MTDAEKIDMLTLAHTLYQMTDDYKNNGDVLYDASRLAQLVLQLHWNNNAE